MIVSAILVLRLIAKVGQKLKLPKRREKKEEYVFH
jgi:hypothetical protein